MEKILAIDYGRARIGLAISDALGITARPLPAVPGQDPAAAVKKIAELCDEEGVGRLLLGLPLRLDGTEGEAVDEVRKFAAQLSATIDLPLDEIDERMSSGQAHAVLKSGGMKHRKRREHVDSTAALLLLKSRLSQK